MRSCGKILQFSNNKLNKYLVIQDNYKQNCLLLLIKQFYLFKIYITLA